MNEMNEVNEMNEFKRKNEKIRNRPMNECIK